MPIYVPTAYSTYADSTTTEGGIFSKYVQAHYRSDADMDWVARTRSALVLDELKYKNFRSFRPKLKLDTTLWQAIERGVSQATIIVIDPKPALLGTYGSFLADGMEWGPDYDWRTLRDQACMALIGVTPFAYLPQDLYFSHPSASAELVARFDEFTPAAIQEQIGPGLKNAKVFAARAFATIDVPSAAQVGSAASPWRSPLARVILSELYATERVFDEEHPKSISFLQDATESIAQALSDMWPIPLTRGLQPTFRESVSQAIDQLQAADIAAGWARELLDLGDTRALLERFERVSINGTWQS